MVVQRALGQSEDHGLHAVLPQVDLVDIPLPDDGVQLRAQGDLLGGEDQDGAGIEGRRELVGGHLIAIAGEARELDAQVRPLRQGRHGPNGLGDLHPPLP